MSEQRAILIFGPTASGKSAIAARIAERVGGIVFNADSMQVYSDLRVLTARPSAEEEARVPHELYGFVPASEAYSAGRYAVDVATALKKTHSRGLRPIIVGGTGLYFMALTEGLSPIPPIANDVRERWRTRAFAAGPGELHAELVRADPAMAIRLAATDTQRIVRALEVYESTGVSLLEWQQKPRARVLDPDTTMCIVIALERDELHQRIEDRFTAMMGAGALDEVQRLAGQRLDPGLPIMGALGVRPLLLHLRGEITREEAQKAAELETRQYAKRQITWARGNMIAWKWIFTQELASCEQEIVAFIDA